MKLFIWRTLAILLAPARWVLYPLTDIAGVLYWLWRRQPHQFWVYIANQWIADDQLVNARFGGDPDETISSRTYKRIYEHKRSSTFARVLYFVLDRIAPGHGPKSVEWDEGIRPAAPSPKE